jgi:hypothetical protein
VLRNGAGWAAFPATDRTLIGQFGFSWPPAIFAAETPILRLGFLWISLDSLVRIETYQLVMRLRARKSFSRAFPFVVSAPQRAPAGLACGTQDCSSSKLNLVSDFLQSVEPFERRWRANPLHRCDAAWWRLFAGSWASSKRGASDGTDWLYNNFRSTVLRFIAVENARDPA